MLIEGRALLRKRTGRFHFRNPVCLLGRMSSRPKPPSYKTRNWFDYDATLKKRGSLAI